MKENIVNGSQLSDSKWVINGFPKKQEAYFINSNGRPCLKAQSNANDKVQVTSQVIKSGYQINHGIDEKKRKTVVMVYDSNKKSKHNSESDQRQLEEISINKRYSSNESMSDLHVEKIGASSTQKIPKCISNSPVIISSLEMDLSQIEQDETECLKNREPTAQDTSLNSDSPKNGPSITKRDTPSKFDHKYMEDNNRWYNPTAFQELKNGAPVIIKLIDDFLNTYNKIDSLSQKDNLNDSDKTDNIPVNCQNESKQLFTTAQDSVTDLVDQKEGSESGSPVYSFSTPSDWSDSQTQNSNGGELNFNQLSRCESQAKESHQEMSDSENEKISIDYSYPIEGVPVYSEDAFKDIHTNSESDKRGESESMETESSLKGLNANIKSPNATYTSSKENEDTQTQNISSSSSSNSYRNLSGMNF